MKISTNVLRKLTTSLFAVVLAAFASSTAHAQILLQINVISSTEVTVSYTGNLIYAATPATGNYDVNDGIDLVSFFTNGQSQNAVINVEPTSTLTAVSSTPTIALDQALTDDYSGAGHQDLNLFGGSASGEGTISFSPSSAAFTGKLTLDLSQLASPQMNMQGNILAGFSPSNGGSPDVVIGQWSVVQAPEPSTWLLVAGSLFLLPLVRCFRRA